jgi:hypothetical protein
MALLEVWEPPVSFYRNFSLCVSSGRSTPASSSAPAEMGSSAGGVIAALLIIAIAVALGVAYYRRASKNPPRKDTRHKPCIHILLWLSLSLCFPKSTLPPIGWWPEWIKRRLGLASDHDRLWDSILNDADEEDEEYTVVFGS